MSQSNAQWAFGTQIQMGDGGGPEVFTSIAEVRDISGPQFRRDTVEVTNHSSPGGWEEFLPTVKRSGQVTFPINYVTSDPTHDVSTGLFSLLASGVRTNFKIVLPDATEWTFPAYVTGFETSEPVNGVVNGAITLKPSGEITLI